MKKIVSAIAVCAVSAMLFASCTRSDNDNMITTTTAEKTETSLTEMTETTTESKSSIKEDMTETGDLDGDGHRENILDDDIM